MLFVEIFLLDISISKPTYPSEANTLQNNHFRHSLLPFYLYVPSKAKALLEIFT